MTGENGTGAVELLGKHDPNKSMRPSGPAECESEIGLSAQRRVKAIGAADHEHHGPSSVPAKTVDPIGQAPAVQVVTALIQRDDRSALGDGLAKFLGLIRQTS